MILRIAPSSLSVDDVARWATVVLSASLSLLPLLFLRGFVSLPLRLAAALALAVWPGQITFSTVVAQDNWVIFPTLALAVLSVRVLASGRVPGSAGSDPAAPPALARPHPLLSGLLVALAAYIRQEMLVVLLPLGLGAAGLIPRSGFLPSLAHLRSRAPRFIAILALALFLFAGQRWLATGKFRVSTDHAGLALLGAVIPDVGDGYWKDPAAWTTSFEPRFAEDVDALVLASGDLAKAEIARRPKFQIVRAFWGVATTWRTPDPFDLYWSLTAPGALPASAAQAGAAFAQKAPRYLDAFALAVHAAFLGALLFALLRRDRVLLLLATPLVLKLAIHAALVTQPRYYLAPIAVEMLMAAIAVDRALHDDPQTARSRRLALLTTLTVAGLAFVLALGPLLARAHTYVLDQDEAEPQLVHHFRLFDPSDRVSLACTLTEGRLFLLQNGVATVKLIHRDPRPGERVKVSCLASAKVSVPNASLAIEDPYALGGRPNRVVQRATVDDGLPWVHDLAAEPGAGWNARPLGPLSPGVERPVTFELEAITEERGWLWGYASTTTLRVRAEE